MSGSELPIFKPDVCGHLELLFKYAMCIILARLFPRTSLSESDKAACIHNLTKHTCIQVWKKKAIFQVQMLINIAMLHE